MKKKNLKKTCSILLAATVSAASLTLTSCGGVWDWLWTRDYGEPLNTDDMIVGGSDTTDETNNLFEGAVD